MQYCQNILQGADYSVELVENPGLAALPIKKTFNDPRRE